MESMVGLSLLLAVVLSSVDPTASECCYVPIQCKEESKTVNRCYDCTEATHYCGNGKCNFLGCNCDGGCRQGDSTLWCWNLASKCKGKYFYQKFALIVDALNEMITKYDTNSDGMLSRKEVNRYISESHLKNINIDEEFNKLDSNRDGLLSPKEIDS